MGGLVVGAGFDADHCEHCRNDHGTDEVVDAVGHCSLRGVSAGLGEAPAGRVGVSRTVGEAQSVQQPWL